LGEKASKKEKDSDEQQPKTFIVDLEELLIKGDLTQNFPLLHGDVAHIPVAGKVFIGGEVRRPGGFPLSRRMTVSQASTLAEGLKPQANGSETKIFRYSGKGNEKDVFTVNVYAIQKGQNEDPYLKDNDIIIIPKSGSKAFLNGFWDFISGRVGAFGLGSI
jgi:polysaccharide export outer membrane protein